MLRAVSFVVLVVAGCAAAWSPPQQAHLALTNSDPTCMVIDFAVEPDSIRDDIDASVYGTVQWRPAGTTAWSDQNVTAGFTYSTDGTQWPGLLFTTSMCGLTPAATYDYQLAVDSKTSAVRTFTAAPSQATYPTTVAVIADMGATSYNPTHPGASNATIKALVDAKGNFSFLLHAGDIAYTNGDQSVWSAYLREVEGVVSEMPYMACVGNHEHWHNFTGYATRFNFPAPPAAVAPSPKNLWFAFTYGPARFVAFSTEHDLSEGSPQHAFLQQELSAVDRTVTPFLITFGHRPTYCSTDDYYDCQENAEHKLRPALEPLFKANNVTLNLAGHLHNYERSYPTLSGSVVSKSYDPAPTYVNIVVGNAGDDEGITTGFTTQPAYSAYREAVLGYSTITFLNSTHLSFEMRDSETHAVHDSVVIGRQM